MIEARAILSESYRIRLNKYDQISILGKYFYFTREKNFPLAYIYFLTGNHVCFFFTDRFFFSSF